MRPAELGPARPRPPPLTVARRRYDPATDTWEPVEDMSARRSGAGVGVVDDALYAVGGHDGPAVRRSVER